MPTNTESDFGSITACLTVSISSICVGIVFLVKRGAKFAPDVIGAVPNLLPTRSPFQRKHYVPYGSSTPDILPIGPPGTPLNPPKCPPGGCNSALVPTNSAPLPIGRFPTISRPHFEPTHDPTSFFSRSLSSAILWASHADNGEVELTVLDTLQSKWEIYLEQAIADWASLDYPVKIISSTVTPMPVDNNDCNHEVNTLKVCSQDYDKDEIMLGQETFILNNKNQIMSGVIMMNDLYLTKLNDTAKQYAMCHLLGQGIGLPVMFTSSQQTMEVNCLLSPYHKNNTKPGVINHKRLVEAYNSHHNSLRSNAQSKSNHESPSFPKSINDLFRQKVKSFKQGIKNDGWKMIMSNSQSEIHSINLGMGYYGQLNILLELN